MRTIRYIFWAASIAAISASCGKFADDAAQKTNGPQDGGKGLYSFSVAAGNGNATRAVLDNDSYAYFWEANDKTGLIITPAGSNIPIGTGNPIVSMSNDGSGTSEHTTFSGKLTQAQLDALSPDDLYNYYSYFPYEIGSVGTLPEILFSIPSTLYVRQNVFNSDYAPMAAQIEYNRPPVAYLDGQQPVHGELIHFDYKHTMAYAAIEMDVRLMPEAVTAITMTNTGGTPICGTYKYNMLTGVGGYVSGGNSITIDITDGLAAGDGNVVYIPMPVADMTGQTFTLTFTSGSSANKYESIATVTGVNFEKGKIHRLRVAPAATYTSTTSFTATKSGYYYVEAWGGNGGASNSGSYGTSSGGSGGVKRGLFYISAGTSFDVVVGTRGMDAGGRRANAAGGTSSIGAGGKGGMGGALRKLGLIVGNDGYAGGGGGGASGIKIGGAVRLAAGGGSGGAGTADHDRSGNRSPMSYSGSAGSDDNQGNNPSGGNGTSSTGPNGADGRSGTNGDLSGYNGGGGGSGGGGGYPRGGFGGGGGQRIGDATGGNPDPRGGGGGGGMNYVLDAENTSGHTLPANGSRPSGRTDGYVVITFIR